MNPLTHAQGKTLLSGACPFCGAESLLLGPSGGLSRNILCEGCRTEFCMGPVPDMCEVLRPALNGRAVSLYGLPVLDDPDNQPCLICGYGFKAHTVEGRLCPVNYHAPARSTFREAPQAETP